MIHKRMIILCTHIYMLIYGGHGLHNKEESAASGK